MSEVNNVSAAKPSVGGAAYIQTSSSASIPTSVDAVLTGFTSLGFLAEDGITNSNSPSATATKAWGGQTVISSQTDKPDTFSFKCIESLNLTVLKTVYGEDNVEGTLETGIEINANAKELPIKAMVFDMVLRGNVAKRIVCKKAQVTNIGDIVYKDGDPVGYTLTITCYPDSDGNSHKEYIKAGASSED